jgi:predicted nucleotidyltransferase
MTLLEKLSALCERHGVDALYVFGSRAAEVAAFVRGHDALDPTSGADVDLGVLPAPRRHLDVHDRVRLTSEFEELLGVPRVDVVLLPRAGPYLALDAVSGELLVSADPVRESEYQLYVLRRAGDLAFYERERRHQLLSGLTP